MPASYTHYAVARETLKALPDELKNKILPHLRLYFFGAQGADFCFFYKFLDAKRKNFGSLLHREGGFAAFQALKAFAPSSPEILAYALGFITHYAADTIFHPFVYRISKKSLLKHSRIENALDGYFKRSMRTSNDLYKDFFNKKLTDEEQNELFLLYAVIAAKCGYPPLSKTAFKRAVRLFNAYLPMPNAFFGNAKDFGDTVVGDGVSDKKIADRLFLCSVFRACELTESFLSCLKSKTPLPADLFGKSFLTGE